MENPNLHPYNDYTHTGAVNSISPVDLNIQGNFKENTDCLDWNAAAQRYGYVASRSTSNSDAKKMLKNAAKSNDQEFVLVQVPITIGQGEKQTDTLHWVGYTGNTTKKGNTTWLEIIPTSDNDEIRDIKNSNWMKKDGKIYVKESAVEGVVVVKKKNK